MRSVAIAAIALINGVVAAGQNAEARFEVASIKLSAGDDNPTCAAIVDHIWCANHPMLDYVSIAYGVPQYLIVSAPIWVTREHFDVDGKLPRGKRLESSYTVNLLARERPEPAVANLLRERTKLRVHRETRELDTYNLLPLRDDGHFGPALCRDVIAACAPSPMSRDGSTVQFSSGGIEWNESLAVMLAGRLQRPVIDQTGLRGPYSLELRMELGGDTVSLFKAVREQLGMVLQDARMAMDVLVIDHIERPAEN